MGMAITIGAALSLGIARYRGWVEGLPLNLAAAVLGTACMRHGIVSLHEKLAPAPTPFGPEPIPDGKLVLIWLHKNWIGLLVLVVIAAAGLGLRARVQQVHRAYLENEKAIAHERWVAAEDLKQLGGHVDSRANDGPILGIQLQRADSLTRRFQPEQIKKREIVDDDVKIVARFPDLENLGIASTEVTDAGLRHLPSLNSLKRLWVECPLATEQGLGIIEKMDHLEHLSLSGSGIRSLSAFRLDRKFVLNSLDLSSTPLTSEACTDLQGLTNLTSLDLSETAVDDRCLEFLVKIANLEELKLDGTQVTDKGILKLQVLSKMKLLAVADTKVSKQGSEQLKSHLPRCQVVLEWVATGPGGMILVPDP